MLYLVLVSFILSCSAVHPRPRVKDSLSDAEHGNHNTKYDHEAFLGKDEAKAFEKLPPDQSKVKLAKIFVQVDEQMNADGFVTVEELKKWMHYTQKQNIRKDSEKRLKELDRDGDEAVTWDEYKEATYGFIEENGDLEGDYIEMVARDEKRFNIADKDADKKLTIDEFSAFLYPEEHDQMKELVFEETFNDIDQDKDGVISLDEYLEDMWPVEHRTKAEESDWVEMERNEFTEFRDKNNDGKLDADEVKDWLLPLDFDYVSKEAKHLVKESDQDDDGKISKVEMLERYDLFVGSQTDVFRELFKSHEEL